MQIPNLFIIPKQAGIQNSHLVTLAKDITQIYLYNWCLFLGSWLFFYRIKVLLFSSAINIFTMADFHYPDGTLFILY